MSGASQSSASTSSSSSNQLTSHAVSLHPAALPPVPAALLPNHSLSPEHLTSPVLLILPTHWTGGGERSPRFNHFQNIPSGTVAFQDFHSAACRRNSCCHLNLLAPAGWKTQEAPRGPSTSRSFLPNPVCSLLTGSGRQLSFTPRGFCVAPLKATSEAGKVAAGSPCLTLVPFDPHVIKKTLTVSLLQFHSPPFTLFCVASVRRGPTEDSKFVPSKIYNGNGGFTAAVPRVATILPVLKLGSYNTSMRSSHTHAKCQACHWGNRVTPPPPRDL